MSSMAGKGDDTFDLNLDDWVNIASRRVAAGTDDEGGASPPPAVPFAEVINGLVERGTLPKVRDNDDDRPKTIRLRLMLEGIATSCGLPRMEGPINPTDSGWRDKVAAERSHSATAPPSVEQFWARVEARNVEDARVAVGAAGGAVEYALGGEDIHEESGTGSGRGADDTDARAYRRKRVDAALGWKGVSARVGSGGGGFTSPLSWKHGTVRTYRRNPRSKISIHSTLQTAFAYTLRLVAGAMNKTTSAAAEHIFADARRELLFQAYIVQHINGVTGDTNLSVSFKGDTKRRIRIANVQLRALLTACTGKRGRRWT